MSGGQKQRISIARAFIKEPDVIILDDALSAVDTKTEQNVLGYLSDALKDKTAIIITHRIYNALNFDQIFVLDEGRIVESGTHESLLEREGAYFELYNQQRIEDEGVQIKVD